MALRVEDEEVKAAGGGPPAGGRDHLPVELDRAVVTADVAGAAEHERAGLDPLTVGLADPCIDLVPTLRPAVRGQMDAILGPKGLDSRAARPRVRLVPHHGITLNQRYLPGVAGTRFQRLVVGPDPAVLVEDEEVETGGGGHPAAGGDHLPVELSRAVVTADVAGAAEHERAGLDPLTLGLPARRTAELPTLRPAVRGQMDAILGPKGLDSRAARPR